MKKFLTFITLLISVSIPMSAFAAVEIGHTFYDADGTVYQFGRFNPETDKDIGLEINGKEYTLNNKDIDGQSNAYEKAVLSNGLFGIGIKDPLDITGRFYKAKVYSKNDMDVKTYGNEIVVDKQYENLPSSSVEPSKFSFMWSGVLNKAYSVSTFDNSDNNFTSKEYKFDFADSDRKNHASAYICALENPEFTKTGKDGSVEYIQHRNIALFQLNLNKLVDIDLTKPVYLRLNAAQAKSNILIYDASEFDWAPEKLTPALLRENYLDFVKPEKLVARDFDKREDGYVYVDISDYVRDCFINENKTPTFAMYAELLNGSDTRHSFYFTYTSGAQSGLIFSKYTK